MTEGPRSTLSPVLPVKSSVLFPHLLLPLAVGRPASVAAVEAALVTEDKTLVIVAQKDITIDEPTMADLYRVGTLAAIKKMERAEAGYQIIVQGIERVELIEAVEATPFLKARVHPLAEPTDEGTEIEALARAMLDQAAAVHAILQPEAPFTVQQMFSQVKDPLHQAYLLASMLNLDLAKAQALLEAPTRADALRQLHEHLTHELQVLELRQKITSQAQSELSREQKEYLLRQQLRAIQEELGERSPEQADSAELRRRFEEADLPENVRKEAGRELSRLERLPTAAPDYQLTRSYLELLLELPWAATTEDVLDLARARQILDEDHYDLKEIKERIIEQLAVLKLNPQAKAPILCFVGPPGVGKTSLGKSIARALGRKFERMSLGGLHDEAELRGHRRTYIGAMPGRLIQAIRRAGLKNPLIMLDEVDKLGSDFRGDPAAALLEILDPAQNFEFHDNYLDLPFDLSKVFFIATANTLDRIPQPLLDRMELLRLAGYSEEEKAQIARQYLIPRQVSETGLKPEQLSIPDDTLARLIRRYTREAGVRELERTLGRLARKVAVRFAEGNSEPVTPRPQDLADLLGPERFTMEEMRRQLPPGVAAGMAWTEAGGEVLYIEAVLLPEGRGLMLTGQLGEVMQESAKTAQSYIWSKAADLGIDRDLIRQSGVHIHVPAGAIRKDGPSAGVTMATALASLYSGHAPRSDTAMTGEISLTGLVLPVGGIKEKVLAATRAGIRRVILPRENGKDLSDLPENVRQQLEVILADRIEDVLAAAVPELAEKAGVGAR
jgi:ATP-dependent Lon protease